MTDVLNKHTIFILSFINTLHVLKLKGIAQWWPLVGFLS